MINLENDFLEISLSHAGAELHRIYHKQFDIEYLWDANPAFWGKHAPVLFPIVGALKENTYYHLGAAYQMPRHGFTREKDFTLLSHDTTVASFELNSNADTKRQYPFDFILRISYTLQNNSLTTTYRLMNKDTKDLFFSIGGHPAFRVPLEPQLKFEDYYLEFPQAETAGRWPLQDNLIAKKPMPFLNDEQQIPLSHALFAKDAVVLKHLKSESVSLKTDKSAHGLTCNFRSFPYLGIWAAPNAPFVCIEPWCGIADSVDHNQQLEQKEGIIKLHEGQDWEKSWSLACW